MDIIVCSLVIYKNDRKQLLDTIGCFLKIDLKVKLILIDNSPNDELKDIERDSRIEYIHNPTNPGFGAAHNIAIKKAIDSGSKYHFIVNPDIYFEGDVITAMVECMANDTTIGMMMPQILNVDGSIQNLPKLLPTPLSILWRKIKKPTSAYEKFINEYELRNVSKDFIYNVSTL